MNQMQYKKLFSIYFGVFAFASLVFPKQTGLLVLLLAVLIIFGLVKKEIQWKLNLISILFIVLYLAYIIGIFFAKDLSNGLKYAEYKLAFLILPLFMSLRTNFQFTLRSAFIGLVLATVVLGIYGLFNACACYNAHNSNWLLYCFSSSFISPIHHPSYYSCFLLFGVTGAWHGYFQKWKGFKLFLVIVYSAFAIVMYYLCLSLAAFLFLGMTLIAIVIYVIYKRFGKWTAISISVGSLILFPLVLFNLPSIGNDLRTTTKSLKEYFESSETFLESRAQNAEIPGNQKRLIMWTVTAELIGENPLGVGTGNVDDYIDPRLEKYGFHKLVEEDLNPHSQYLQTTLEIGILGGVILTGLFLTIIWIGIKKRSALLLLLGTSLAFNSLFESIFQHQSGVVFFTFWILLVLISLNSKEAIVKDSLTLP